MSLVILPQALRVIIPPLISQYLNLTKNSSLAIAVGYMDVRSHAGRHHHQPDRARARGDAASRCCSTWSLSLLISGVMNVYNNSVKLKER